MRSQLCIAQYAAARGRAIQCLVMPLPSLAWVSACDIATALPAAAMATGPPPMLLMPAAVGAASVAAKLRDDAEKWKRGGVECAYRTKAPGGRPAIA